MANCSNCLAEFGDVFTFRSLCPRCTAQKEAEERAEERAAERESRQRDAEERRHNERLEAEDNRFTEQQELEDERARQEEALEFDRESQEEARQRDRAYAREAAEAHREERREAVLAKERDLAANAWRYAAEAQLQQADHLYQGGAKKDALALAMSASVLGLDAQRLIGWIHRDLGNKKEHLASIKTQSGLLRVAGSSNHQQQGRVLSEILAFTDEREELLKLYFETANESGWLPYAIHPLLAANNLLSLDAYRVLILKHIEEIGADEQAKQSKHYGLRFLEILANVPKNEELMGLYVSAVSRQPYFPHELINFLLNIDEGKRAAEIFRGTAKNVGDENVLLWKVYPFGMELTHRNLEPKVWLSKFEVALLAIPFNKIQGSAVGEVFAFDGIGATTKAQIRNILVEKGKRTYASERRAEWKRLAKEKRVSDEPLPRYQSPHLFAFVVSAGFAAMLLLAHADLPAAVGVSLVIYVGALMGKRSSNAYFARQIWCAVWENRRRAEMTSTLQIDASALGSIVRPSQSLRLVIDFATVFLLFGLSAGTIAYLIKDAKNSRGLAGASPQWTRDWRVFVPVVREKQTARLTVDSKGNPALEFYEHTLFGTVKSSPRWTARVSQCSIVGSLISCQAATSIFNNPSYQSTPSRLELNLGSGTGTLSVFARNEPALIVELSDTPVSTLGAPAWIGFKKPISTGTTTAAAASSSGVSSNPAVTNNSSGSHGLSMVKDIRNGCRVWKPAIGPSETVSWSGDCVDSFAEGPGVARWAVDGLNTFTYEGTFRAGLLQGKGKMTAASGDRYEGNYQDGKRDGRGTYTAIAGERYEGEFKDNKRLGRGASSRDEGSHPASHPMQSETPLGGIDPPSKEVPDTARDSHGATPSAQSSGQRTIRRLCEGKNPVAEQICYVHECRKVEHASAEICVRLKEDAERRQEQQQQR